MTISICDARTMAAKRKTHMRGMHRFLSNAVMGSIFLLLLAGIGATAQAQDRMTVQATARGTSTQLGRVVDVTITIDQLSTPDDQKTLQAAFASSGQAGLVDALGKMSSKGRVRFSSGGVGNDVKYIIELPAEKGSRRLRLVTDRNLAFGELANSTRSSEYRLGAIEFTLTPDGKGTGRVLPACKVGLDKKKQIKIETFQFPYDLSNFRVSKD
jgi:hypothetical protein